MNDKEKKRKKRKVKKASWQVAKQKASDNAVISRFPLTLVKAEANICGECQACCELVGVHELEKPTNTRCIHQCDKGCNIYSDRPKSCQTYYCLWQAGILKGGIDKRPDKFGILFDFSSSKEKVIGAWETRENAVSEPQVIEVLKELGNHFIVYVRRFKSNLRKVIGPQHLLADTVFDEHN